MFIDPDYSADESAMKKSGKVILEVLEAVKDLGCFANGALQSAAELTEAESALANVSNYDLVFVLRPVAKELSELTVHRYVDILDQAREMILEGKDIPDVLWHFDLMLYDLKHGRK